jgi:hypothetical protein
VVPDRHWHKRTESSLRGQGQPARARQADSSTIDMVTVGIWNPQGTMDEEFFFRDNQTFYAKMGLG